MDPRPADIPPDPEIAHGTDYPGPVTEDGPATEGGGGAGQPGAAAGGRAEAPGAGVFEEDVIVVATQESAGYEGTDTADPAAAEGAAAEGAASARAASAADPLGNGGAEQWSEIKAMFVDDPGASVRRASGLVEEAIEGLTATLRQRQDSLASWHAGDAAGTEELRTALRGYRDMFDQLEQMSGHFGGTARV